MTKSQSNKAFKTASTQQADTSANAQSSYDAAQGDIGDFKSALAKFSSENPYVTGGAYDTAVNRTLSDTAAAGSQAADQAIQAAAVRSGQNPAAAIAAGEQVREQNTRAQMDEGAKAEQARIAGLSGYNQTALQATAEPATMEQQLMASQLGAANSALSAETEASKTPSFWQELGQGVINAGSSFAGGMGAGMAKCWIAARLYGGWFSPKTVLVRAWLIEVFAQTWHGALVMMLYGMIGQRVADRWMPRSRVLTWAMRKLFDAAVARSEMWLATAPGRRTFEFAMMAASCRGGIQ